jgi:nicotinamidase-related amidase
MTRALLCIDFINDIIGEDGKLAAKGYRSFADAHATLEVVSGLQQTCRESDIPIIHVRVGFDPLYLNHPSGSPLFGTAAQFEALKLGAWGTEFVPEAKPAVGELVFNKPRVSAFYGTALESALRAQLIDEVLIAGVATDLAVEAAARDAHDRDLRVTVIGDACAAASVADHQRSLETLGKIAEIANSHRL